ncbi:MAG TPA: hypothetical protein VFP53_07195 [Sphingomicrobium sp.]|nr:hypothetical protein [Sphingomicrobium sp.]
MSGRQNRTGRSYKPRATRISVRRSAVLIEPDGCRVDIVILNVSSAGFRLKSDAELVVGEEVEIQLPKLEPARAVIQWTQGREAGGIFLDPASL